MTPEVGGDQPENKCWAAQAQTECLIKDRVYFLNIMVQTRTCQELQKDLRGCGASPLWLRPAASDNPSMATPPPFLSIIVPVLNEGPRLQYQLQALAPWRSAGVEVLLVDGGSSDGSVQAVACWVDRVLLAPRGRASQMNAGAAQALGELLLFLHADTCLPDDALPQLQALTAGQASWGRFDVQIDSPRPLLRVVSCLMNQRSRLSGVATGDQAIFVRRQVFEAVGGFPDIALMEDIALSQRLLRLARPACLRLRVRTSARRWEKHGVWRTIALMWCLRAAFFVGVHPDRLARLYGYQPR